MSVAFDDHGEIVPEPRHDEEHRASLGDDVRFRTVGQQCIEAPLLVRVQCTVHASEVPVLRRDVETRQHTSDLTRKLFEAESREGRTTPRADELRF